MHPGEQVDSEIAALIEAHSLHLGRRARILSGAARQAILAPALAAARASRQRFAPLIAFVLNRSVLVLVDGFYCSALTFPLSPTNVIAPLILVNAKLLAGSPRQLAHVLLHEAAHHCLVVWPEWRLGVNAFARRVLFFRKWRNPRWPVYPEASIYGPGVNSADRVAEAILADGWSTAARRL